MLKRAAVAGRRLAQKACRPPDCGLLVAAAAATTTTTAATAVAATTTAVAAATTAAAGARLRLEAVAAVDRAIAAGLERNAGCLAA